MDPGARPWHGLHLYRGARSTPRLGKARAVCHRRGRAEEGPHILSNVVNVAPEQLAIGLPVEVTFAELDGSTKLPLFQAVQR